MYSQMVSIQSNLLHAKSTNDPRANANETPNFKLQFNVCDNFGSKRLYLTNKAKKPPICSVMLQHAGSRRAGKKYRGKHETKSGVSPFTSWVLFHFLSESEESFIFHTYSGAFSNETLHR